MFSAIHSETPAPDPEIVDRLYCRPMDGASTKTIMAIAKLRDRFNGLDGIYSPKIVDCKDFVAGEIPLSGMASRELRDYEVRELNEVLYETGFEVYQNVSDLW